MPTRTSVPVGAPSWVDLMTSDPDRSRAFYSELFGWTAEEPNEEFGGYFNFTHGGVRVAGGMKAQPDAGIPGCLVDLPRHRRRRQDRRGRGRQRRPGDRPAHAGR